jgi:hypothetical protein
MSGAGGDGTHVRKANVRHKGANRHTGGSALESGPRAQIELHVLT